VVSSEGRVLAKAPISVVVLSRAKALCGKIPAVWSEEGCWSPDCRCVSRGSQVGFLCIPQGWKLAMEAAAGLWLQGLLWGRCSIGLYIIIGCRSHVELPDGITGG